MLNLTSEQRHILEEALDRSAVPTVAADDDLAGRRFYDVIDALGNYLLVDGIGPDEQVNDLGRQIEAIEDLLVNERIRQAGSS